MSLISTIRLYLGFIPTTEHIEKTREALQKEFTEYTAFAASAELAHYLELKSFVQNSAFPETKKRIMGQKFSEQPEYQQWQRFQELKKSTRLKTYFKVAGSADLQQCIETEKSSELKEYIALEQYIHSAEFAELQSNTPSKEFKTTDAWQKLQRHKQLKSLPVIKKYYKFIQSEKYKTYQEVKNSPELEEFEKLEKIVTSEKFVQLMNYMALSPKQKWMASTEYAKEQEYINLSKSEKIKWYFSLEGTHKFDEIKHWNLTFSEDFDQKKLSDKWLTKYYYGETIIKDSYSLFNDYHFVTDGANINISDSVAKIITKAEEKPIEGKAWHAINGFYNKKFNFSSGLLNTGKSFRQLYGKFEIKVKISDSGTVVHQACLNTDKALPQLTLFKYEKGMLKMGIFWGSLTKKGINKKCTFIPGKKFTKDYFILTLIWTPGCFIWKINGLTAFTVKSEEFNTPGYIQFASGIYEKPEKAILPATMEIDWIKIYKENNPN